MTETEFKFCTKCEEEKHVDDFPKSGNHCKKCIKLYKQEYRKNNKNKISKSQKENYKKNKEKILKRQKQYYKNNKEKIIEYQGKYREKNKENIAVYKKVYYKSNKEKISNSNKTYYKNNKNKVSKQRYKSQKKYINKNKEKYLLNSAKRRSKDRNIEFSLELSDITSVICNVCPLLNIEMKINKNIVKDNSFTLDRIDPFKGYICGNIIVISNKANKSKSNATIEEYEKIVNNLKKIIDGWRPEGGGYISELYIKYILYNMKARVIKHNLLFDIDELYLKKIFPKDNKCPLLGVNLENGKEKIHRFSPSLDRIIPEKGYIKGNVIFVSHRANTIKSNLSLNEMRLLLSNWKKILKAGEDF
jgi:hypothetical protein